VARLLPPEVNVRVRGRRIAQDAAALARADAALMVVDATRPAQSLARLPHPDLWLALLRAARPSPEPGPLLLVSRLPNARRTLAAVALVRPGTGAFDRLDAARRMVKAVLEPAARRLACRVDLPRTHDAAGWRESLVSAALAAAAPMPDLRSTPCPVSALREIEVTGATTADFRETLATSEGNHLARWLTTQPPNRLDSLTYRRALGELAKREGWAFRHFDARALARLGAGAFLAVMRASAKRSAGIVRLRYRAPGRARRARIALVGKGICFDTGGINLKSHKGMYLMHGDMQGSAVAVGTLLACTRLGMPFDVDCWLAISENDIGPGAYRPQEVVRAANGTTIQVVHSDAEGRMVLADTLALASRERPRLLLDFATLTGACVNALTDRYSGAFTNRPRLHDALHAAGRESGERVWCFPMDEDFDRELESPIADVMQCALESKGDHILAARFLSRFVADGIPWVHVDLSAAERKGGLAHVPTEFTGFGVRFATRLLGDRALLDGLADRA
jgi:leucyl aminopeptidase